MEKGLFDEKKFRIWALAANVCQMVLNLSLHPKTIIVTFLFSVSRSNLDIFIFIPDKALCMPLDLVYIFK